MDVFTACLVKHLPYPPGETVSENLTTLLKNEQRLEFFAGLSDKTLKQLAERLIHILRTVVNWEILGEPRASRAKREGE